MRRHARAWATLAVIVVGVVAWRLVDAASSRNPEPPTSPTGSSVSTSTATIGDDGDVHVVVDLHFAAPVNHLTLQVPQETWAGGEFQPVVDGIVLDIPGRQVELADSLTTGQEQSVTLPAYAVEVRLAYDATGTFVASTPSSPGRGLVLLTPLTVEERETLSQVEVLDDRVLNLGCVGTGELNACGIRDGDAWIATPVADAQQVVAQVDLEPR